LILRPALTFREIRRSYSQGWELLPWVIPDLPRAIASYKIQEYDLPANGIYAPFVDRNTGTDVPLFEMVTEDYVPLPGEVIKRLDLILRIFK